LASNPLAEHCVGPAVPIALADDYRPAVDVIFGQLLGLFFSLRWKLMPDCPSPNGAISRVVQSVSIHV
jgi:tagatose-6-phosphate ketose/aldose isomerase